MSSYTEYDEYRSGRQTVFKFLAENPHHTFASLKKKLYHETVFYSLKDQTIRNYMSTWRRLYSRSGVVPRLHRGFGVLETGFDADLWEVAPSFGWRISRNRNRERLWSESGISLGWHRNGTVVFRFKDFRPQGHLLGVFVRAFWRVLLSTGKGEREVFACLDMLFKERYSHRGFHSVYETWQHLPKLTVKDFKRSHGITIKLADGSHPTALEVEQVEPFWFPKIEKVLDRLGAEIESHLALIKSWREESAQNKQTLRKMCQILNRQQENIDKLTSRLFEFLQQMEKRGVSNG